jgi:hypothetical protein
MPGTSDTRLHHGLAHLPVEEGTADGKTRISCAGAKCTAWDPRPCESRREAQFWYNRHISQPLLHHLR